MVIGVGKEDGQGLDKIHLVKFYSLLLKQRIVACLDVIFRSD